MNSQVFAQFPSLEHMLSALPAGAFVSPSVVPFAARCSGVGAPVFVAALPASVAVVSGAAVGVDHAAEEAARARGLPVVSLPAAWSARGQRAGVMRNAEVVAQADVVVAFWDGISPGTQDVIRRARK